MGRCKAAPVRSGASLGGVSAIKFAGLGSSPPSLPPRSYVEASALTGEGVGTLVDALCARALAQLLPGCCG